MIEKLIDKFFQTRNITILGCVVLGYGAYYFLKGDAKDVVMAIVGIIGALNTHKGA